MEHLSRQARARVLAVVGLQLALSVRFAAGYVAVHPRLACAAYVAVGLLVAWAVLRTRRVLRLLGGTPALALGLVSLTALVAVAYPRADALREVGRGSDQDDCVRALVANVAAARAPFGVGYFGDPCSTGPTELAWNWPLLAWPDYLVVLPALALLLGWWVLSLLVDRTAAVLLSLTQLGCWLLLELACSGSDLVAIAWLLAAGATATLVGLRAHRPGLVVAGGTAYALFAGSRLPFLVVAAVSLLLLTVAAGRRVLLVAVPALALAGATYAGTWLVAPDRFRPGHLVGKSVRVLGDLGLLPLGLAGAGLVLAAAVGWRGVARTLRDQPLAAQVVVIAVPMAPVAAWDLLRHEGDLAAWEALHYLWLAVPMLLVALAASLVPRGESRSPQARTGPTVHA